MSPPHGTASPLLDELLTVHDWLRRDLEECRGIAHRVRQGEAAAAVRNSLRDLQTAGPLWQLRVNCLRYCALVHNHHQLEDAMLFPALRRYEPALGRVIDRLERDHQVVSDLLDEVTELADGLSAPTPPSVGERLASALDRLGDHLTEHLALEERTLAPVLLRHRLSPHHLSA